MAGWHECVRLSPDKPAVAHHQRVAGLGYSEEGVPTVEYFGGSIDVCRVGRSVLPAPSASNGVRNIYFATFGTLVETGLSGGLVVFRCVARGEDRIFCFAPGFVLPGAGTWVQRKRGYAAGRHIPVRLHFHREKQNPEHAASMAVLRWADCTRGA